MRTFSDGELSPTTLSFFFFLSSANAFPFRHGFIHLLDERQKVFCAYREKPIGAVATMSNARNGSATIKGGLTHSVMNIEFLNPFALKVNAFESGFKIG